MASSNKYKSGESYIIYRLVDNREMGMVKVTSSMCQLLFNRMVFFKFGLNNNEHKAIKKGIKK